MFTSLRGTVLVSPARGRPSDTTFQVRGDVSVGPDNRGTITYPTGCTRPASHDHELHSAVGWLPAAR
jgi:hypothetical protein